MSYRLIVRRYEDKRLVLYKLILFFCFSFTLCKCQYRKNELLALELAKKENIAEIVEFYGVKIKGRNACIFMAFMAGKEKRMCKKLFFFYVLS